MNRQDILPLETALWTKRQYPSRISDEIFVKPAYSYQFSDVSQDQRTYHHPSVPRIQKQALRRYDESSRSRLGYRIKDAGSLDRRHAAPGKSLTLTFFRIIAHQLACQASSTRYQLNEALPRHQIHLPSAVSDPRHS
jgi:hypothetical protein